MIGAHLGAIENGFRRQRGSLAKGLCDATGLRGAVRGGMQPSNHFSLQDLDGHATRPLASQMPTHAIGHGVQPKPIVAQEIVFVVIALETDIGREPAARLHDYTLARLAIER